MSPLLSQLLSSSSPFPPSLQMASRSSRRSPSPQIIASQRSSDSSAVDSASFAVLRQSGVPRRSTSSSMLVFDSNTASGGWGDERGREVREWGDRPNLERVFYLPPLPPSSPPIPSAAALAVCHATLERFFLLSPRPLPPCRLRPSLCSRVSGCPSRTSARHLTHVSRNGVTRLRGVLHNFQ